MHRLSSMLAHPRRDTRDIAHIVRTVPGAHSVPGSTRNAFSSSMATMPFPHHYTVDLGNDRLTAEPRHPIAVGAPPQFGGANNVWSPEELLIGAVLLCVKTTFDAFARKAELAIHSWMGRGTGVLDKGPTGPVFTSIRIDLDIETASGAESPVRDLLHTVKRSCIISRAISAPVEIVANVRGRE